MMKLYVNILRLALWQKVNLMLIKIYIIVATAHLAKFEDVIEPILDIQVSPTSALQKLLDKGQYKVAINKSWMSFVRFMQKLLSYKLLENYRNVVNCIISQSLEIFI